ncbi:hypothetical protein [Bacillus cereus group sp. BfR-BA-01326]|uniref:hypothetical protein n=1 Tax=Bacillus cereus group sp. BfR-BA-01326 TaxID=2920302 RepID=UPI001F587F2C|nr:hypothetical protein [Bacillus cereus group sp. BfR-BA-01326]
MPNSINYAQKYSQDLDQALTQNMLTAELETAQVNWLDAKTFHVPTLSVSGFKTHSRNGGYNKGNITKTDKPYTITFDRDIELFIDEADIDESNKVAEMGNITRVFVETQATPEIDAYRFAKLVAGAGVKTAEALPTEPGDVLKRLKEDIGKARKYGVANLVVYVSSDVMNAIESARLGMGKVDLLNEGTAVETRVTKLDGVKLIEVFASERFYDKFDFTEGFKPAEGSKAINWIIVAKPCVIAKAKINSIKLFLNGQHTQGDGALYQQRLYHDLFVLENKKDGVVVSHQA